MAASSATVETKASMRSRPASRSSRVPQKAQAYRRTRLGSSSYFRIRRQSLSRSLGWPLLAPFDSDDHSNVAWRRRAFAVPRTIRALRHCRGRFRKLCAKLDSRHEFRPHAFRRHGRGESCSWDRHPQNLRNQSIQEFYKPWREKPIDERLGRKPLERDRLNASALISLSYRYQPRMSHVPFTAQETSSSLATERRNLVVINLSCCKASRSSFPTLGMRELNIGSQQAT